MSNNIFQKNRVLYIEPNNIFSEQEGVDAKSNIPVKQEDLNMYVNLKVKIPSRFQDSFSNYNSIFSGSRIAINEDKKENDLKEYNLLTTSYVNVGYTEENGKEYGFTHKGELFGISNIDISFDAQFFPQVTIEFTDVRGEAIMSPSEAQYSDKPESQYSNREKEATITARHFFNSIFSFPFPIFTLEVKGYYGTPIVFDMAVRDFKSQFDSMTGNFNVKIEFVGYLYGVYTDIPLSYVLTSPYFDIRQTLTVNSEDEYSQYNGKLWNGFNFSFDDKIKIPTYLEFNEKFKKLKDTYNRDKLEEQYSGILDEIDEHTELVSVVNDKINCQALKDEVGTTIEKIYGFFKNGTNASYIIGDVVIGVDRYGKDINLQDDTFKELEPKIREIKNISYIHSLFNYVDENDSTLKKEVIKQKFEIKVNKEEDKEKIIEETKKEIKEYLEKITKGQIIDENIEKIINDINFELKVKGDIRPDVYIYSYSFFGDEIKNSVYEEAINGIIETKGMEINKNQDGINKLITRLGKKILGYTPSLKNTYDMLFSYLSVFMKHMENTVKEAKNRKYIPEKLKDTYKTDYDVTKKQIPPFPLVAQKNSENGKYEAIYPGKISSVWNKQPEMVLVDNIYSNLKEIKPIIQQQSEEINELFGKVVQGEYTSNFIVPSANYIPLFPSDIVRGNPYEKIFKKFVYNNLMSDEGVDYLFTFILMRIASFKYYYADYDAALIGLIEGYNIRMAADNETLLKNLSRQFEVLKSGTEKSSGTPFSELVKNGSVGNIEIIGDKKPIMGDGKINTDLVRITIDPYEFSNNAHAVVNKDININIKEVCTLEYEGGIEDEFIVLPLKPFQAIGNHAYNKLSSILPSNLIEQYRRVINFGSSKPMKDEKDHYISSGIMKEYNLDENKKLVISNSAIDYEFINQFIREILDGFISFNASKPRACDYTYSGLLLIYRAFFYFLHGLCNAASVGGLREEEEKREKLYDHDRGAINVLVKNGAHAYSFIDILLASAALFAGENTFCFYDGTNSGIGELFNNRITYGREGESYQQYITKKYKEKYNVKIYLPLAEKNEIQTGSQFFFPSLAEQFPKDPKGCSYYQAINDNDSEFSFNYVGNKFHKKQELLSYSFRRKVLQVYFDMFRSKDYKKIFATYDKSNIIEVNRYRDDGKTLQKEYIHSFNKTYSTINMEFEVGDIPKLHNIFIYYINKLQTNASLQNNTAHYSTEGVPDQYQLFNDIYLDGDVLDVLDKYFDTEALVISCGNIGTPKKNNDDYNFEDGWLDNFYYTLHGTIFNGINPTNYEILNDKEGKSSLDDNAIKGNIYYTLKNLYDKWSIGNTIRLTDITKKKMEYLDFFGNNIGDELMVNLDKLYKYFSTTTTETSPSFYEALNSIAQENDCLFLPVPFAVDNKDFERIFEPMPSYYGKNIKEETSKFIVIHYGDTSHFLNIDNGENNDDGYVFNNDIDNELFGGTNGSTIQAFGVTYAKQNQNFFNKINVNMDSPSVTDTSIINTLDLASGAANGDIKTPIFQTSSLYPIFANRSYTCDVEMMGCANIAPLMYFQLNNIPMFRGAYLITNVSHSIIPGKFTTKFSGVRMSRYSSPINRRIFSIDDLMSKFSLTTVDSYGGIKNTKMGFSEVRNIKYDGDESSIITYQNHTDWEEKDQPQIIKFLYDFANFLKENYNEKKNDEDKIFITVTRIHSKNNPGNDKSEHAHGRAVDFSGGEKNNIRLFSLLVDFIANDYPFDQVVLETNEYRGEDKIRDRNKTNEQDPTNIHVGIRENGNKGEIFQSFVFGEPQKEAVWAANGDTNSSTRTITVPINGNGNYVTPLYNMLIVENKGKVSGDTYCVSFRFEKQPEKSVYIKFDYGEKESEYIEVKGTGETDTYQYNIANIENIKFYINEEDELLYKDSKYFYGVTCFDNSINQQTFYRLSEKNFLTRYSSDEALRTVLHKGFIAKYLEMRKKGKIKVEYYPNLGKESTQ